MCNDIIVTGIENKYYWEICYSAYNSIELDGHELFNCSEVEQIRGIIDAYGELDVICSGNVIFIRLNTNGCCFDIDKFSEEWYVVIFNSSYFKCDQFDALIRFIQDKMLCCL